MSATCQMCGGTGKVSVHVCTCLLRQCNCAETATRIDGICACTVTGEPIVGHEYSFYIPRKREM